MKIEEALKIIKEHQKWRRGEPPYDGETPEDYKPLPYSPKVIGEALDVLIKYVEKKK